MPADVVWGERNRHWHRDCETCEPAPLTHGPQNGEHNMETVVRDPALMRVALVDELPAACGGGVAVIDDCDVLWVLLEQRGDPPRRTEVDMQEWAAVGHALVEDGLMVTCADLAHIFRVELETAKAACWSYAWEWWQLFCADAC